MPSTIVAARAAAVAVPVGGFRLDGGTIDGKAIASLPGSKNLLCDQLGFVETWEANDQDKGRHVVFTQPLEALADRLLRHRVKAAFWAVSMVLCRTAPPSRRSLEEAMRAVGGSMKQQANAGDIDDGYGNPPTPRPPIGAIAPWSMVGVEWASSPLALGVTPDLFPESALRGNAPTLTIECVPARRWP